MYCVLFIIHDYYLLLKSRCMVDVNFLFMFAELMTVKIKKTTNVKATITKQPRQKNHVKLYKYPILYMFCPKMALHIF